MISNYRKPVAAIVAIKTTVILSVLMFTVGCPTLEPGPLGGPFTLQVLPPTEGGFYFIEQGGATDAEVGVEELNYEVQMSSSFSSDALLTVVSDLPTGITVQASSVISLNMPFALEPDASFNHLFTIWADDSAVVGSYEITITVSGLVNPGGTISTQSDTFTLSVIERN